MDENEDNVAKLKAALEEAYSDEQMQVKRTDLEFCLDELDCVVSHLAEENERLNEEIDELRRSQYAVSMRHQSLVERVKALEMQ